jgi:hypothetical protein
MPTPSKFIAGATSAVVLATMVSTVPPVYADDAGAFVGGMLASRVMTNMRDRTEAEQDQAYYAQQQAQQSHVQQQPVQQAAPTQTAEQKLAQLDKMAAGGYITPEEYKAKRKQVIDAM